jgi:integrase/recombinase XerD
MTAIDFHLPNEVDLILKSLKTEKQKTQILLMLDGGLRVSEMCNLDWTDLDFRRKVINVRSLKKKDKGAVRSIPMSSRLYDSFADYVQKKGKQKGYVFATSEGNAPTRQTINYLFRRIEKDNPEIQHTHPHKMRHTFATQLRANGAELEDIRDLLGHEKLETSLIYAHADPDRLRSIIDKSQPKKTFWEKFKDKYITPRRKAKISILTSDPKLLVGRDYEVKQIEKLVEKEVSILITGPVGVGKTHLINNLKFKKTVLDIDDCKDFKKSVANIILHLFGGDKEQAAQLIFSNSDRSALEIKISKHSTINLCELLKQITDKNEYILKIADMDQVTPGVVKALQILKEHFIIITTARSLKIPDTPFCWDFERIEVKPLKREESIRLFHRLTDSYQIADIDFVRNKIYDTTEGNPRAIFELSQRITKEEIIDGRTVEDICNNYIGKIIKEIDMSIYLLFLFIGTFAVMKIRGREMGEEGWRNVSSGVFVILLFARYFFSKTRRQTI